MSNRKFIISVACGFALLAGTFAQQSSATVIAGWTFETSQPSLSDSTTIGPIAPEVGAGAASGQHVSAATDWSNPAGNGSLESFSSNNWAIGDYYEFQVDASLYQDIKISWDQVSSSTGPIDFKLQYSTDGSTFSDFTVYSVGTDSWSTSTADPNASYAEDLSSITSLNYDSSIFFRLTATSAPGGTTGTNRVDNVVISGVPEPTTCVLMLIGLAGMACRRRL